jgi:hypothetical protein
MSALFVTKDTISVVGIFGNDHTGVFPPGITSAIVRQNNGMIDALSGINAASNGINIINNIVIVRVYVVVHYIRDTILKNIFKTNPV